MNYLHVEQQWELMRSRQAELLKEAENEHLSRLVKQPQQNWWKKLIRQQAQSPAIALNSSASPELG